MGSFPVVIACWALSGCRDEKIKHDLLNGLFLVVLPVEHLVVVTTVRHLVVVGTCILNGFCGLGSFPVVMGCWALSGCRDVPFERILRIGLFSCNNGLLGT